MKRRYERTAPSVARLPWSEDMTNRLCDLIADGKSFAECAKELGTTRVACVGRFDRIRKTFGWQAA